mmetsp:Transcript_8152/g.12091  ORF Transcript_8152/g.12091 Transcript_8152/m.12091 type:complete len:247 (-) Transcript_8152:807-1547(-)
MKRTGYGRGGRTEYISLDGLRVDGRRPEEVRHVACHIGTPGNSVDGNAYFEQGNTRVLATVVGPRDRKSGTHRNEEGMDLKCNYSNRQDRRSAKEIEPLLEDMFRSVILVDQYPKSRLDINVEVVQADGSLLCAAVNAISLALLHAGVPMKDMICAATVGMIDGQCMIDLNGYESSADGPVLQIGVLAQTGSISLLDISTRLSSASQLQEMVSVGTEGCKSIYSVVRSEAHDLIIRLASSRGVLST